MKGMYRASWDKNNELMRGVSRERHRSSPTNMSLESIDYPPRGSRSSTTRDSFSDNSEYSGPAGSMDMSAHNLDFSNVNLSPANPASSVSTQFLLKKRGFICRTFMILTFYLQRDLEAEMRRLKLELKQTMELYSSACKEALNAKQKVIAYQLFD